MQLTRRDNKAKDNEKQTKKHLNEILLLINRSNRYTQKITAAVVKAIV
jgi:hypothetical protein